MSVEAGTKINSGEFSSETGPETRMFVISGDDSDIDQYPKQLLVRFTGRKLIRILEWYNEMMEQTHDSTISTLVELLPNAKTRRSYELGLSVIGNSGTDLEGLSRIIEASVWQRGESRVIEYVFRNPLPQTSTLLVEDAR
mgnify:CR=1 FL=1